MIKVTEIGGVARVFNLNKGTLRLLARQSKTISDGEVSEELKIAEKQGIIYMQAVTTDTTNKKKGENE
jgi:hypothetical protein